MPDLRDAAIVASLANELHVRGSFCGETHIQKATYLLKELTGVDVDFEFQLYLYGPYSFDLHGELEAYRADDFLELVPRNMGSSWIPGARYELLRNACAAEVDAVAGHLEFIADRLATLDVKKLESRATAFYVTKNRTASQESRLTSLCKIKKHVPRPDALEAIRAIDHWLAEWHAELQSPSTMP